MCNKIGKATDHIAFAAQNCGVIIAEHDIRQFLKSIYDANDPQASYENIKSIFLDESLPLYPWIPASIFNLFGWDTYKECDLNIEAPETFLLIHPKNENFPIEAAIDLSGFSIEKFPFVFSRELVARIYGGYPWFKAYLAGCEHFDFLGKHSTILKLKTFDGKECLRKLIDMKNSYRKLHPESVLHLEMKKSRGFSFDYVTYPFHTPNPIENRHQSRAIEKAIRAYSLYNT